MEERTKAKGGLGYKSVTYGFPVMTSQETEIRFDELSKLVRKKSELEVEYREKPLFSLPKVLCFKKANH